MTVNPDLVIVDEQEALRVRGAMAMNWANGLSRSRRQNRFRLRQISGSTLPVVVAEGDSWFQFPLLIDDVVDQLDPQHQVWCVSAAGDTLENMVFADPEYRQALEERGPPKAMLFSGAGNDVIGTDTSDGIAVIAKVVRAFEPGLKAKDYIDTDAFRERLDFVERAYRRILSDVDKTFGGRVSVLCHGYDRAIPFGAPGDGRDPSWAAKDGWLAGPLRSRGIVDHRLQREIVSLMIDALNALQKRLCGGNNAGGAFARAHHADLRGTLPEVADWADELHPTSAGFAKVAAKMRPALAALVK